MRTFALLLTSLTVMCSFAAAEGESGVEGTISISPAHGGPERVGVPNSRPLANVEFMVTKDGGAQVASFTTDAEGKFRVSLGAGHYSVARKDAPAKRIGRCGPFDVDVVAGQIAKVDWMCDSGMR